MNPLSKIPPSSVRPGSRTPPSMGARSAESRPYYTGNYTGTGGNRYPAKPILPLFPHESEDARLTGETRSLFRRLLALNLPVAASGAVSVNVIQSRVGKIA
jgi:hypothetical protein